MGEFHAWAVTGQVSRLQVWSDADSSSDTDDAGDGSVRIATRMAEKQQFLLRSRDGREVQVQVADSGVALQNTHIATVAWAAREGASHGHAIYLKNHTTGAASRLEVNIRQLRTQVNTGKLVRYGALGAVPAAFALCAWLLIPGSVAELDAGVVLVGMSVALVAVFTVGIIVAKLVFDYLRSEEDDRIWAAVSKAIAHDSVLLERPRPPVPAAARPSATDSVIRASAHGRAGRAGRSDR